MDEDYDTKKVITTRILPCMRISVHLRDGRFSFSLSRDNWVMIKILIHSRNSWKAFLGLAFQNILTQIFAFTSRINMKVIFWKTSFGTFSRKNHDRNFDEVTKYFEIMYLMYFPKSFHTFRCSKIHFIAKYCTYMQCFWNQYIRVYVEFKLILNWDFLQRPSVVWGDNDIG